MKIPWPFTLTVDEKNINHMSGDNCQLYFHRIKLFFGSFLASLHQYISWIGFITKRNSNPSPLQHWVNINRSSPAYLHLE